MARFRVILRTVQIAAAASLGLTTLANPAYAESWATLVRTSSDSKWSVFRCSGYMITTICRTEKKYFDPGSIPSTISVGDTIRYTAKDGTTQTFTVRNISFSVHQKDTDIETSDGERVHIPKRTPQCVLYDGHPEGDLVREHPSTIPILGCQPVR